MLWVVVIGRFRCAWEAQQGRHYLHMIVLHPSLALSPQKELCAPLTNQFLHLRTIPASGLLTSVRASSDHSTSTRIFVALPLTAYLTRPHPGRSQYSSRLRESPLPLDINKQTVFRLVCPVSLPYITHRVYISSQWLMLPEVASRRRLSFTPYIKCIRYIKWR
jgi:hypothetical protein